MKYGIFMQKEYKCYMVLYNMGKNMKVVSKGKGKRITFRSKTVMSSQQFQKKFSVFLTNAKNKYGIIDKIL